jgi:uncharacterized protein (DUF2141 family)
VIAFVALAHNSNVEEIGQDGNTVSFELKISNIEESEGTIYIGIFADEEEWKDLEPTHRLEAKPSKQGSSVTVDLEPGEYAASVYQDVNEDGEFNRKGILKLPGEPYGLSNNARPRFGLPGWKRVKFNVDQDSKEHTIKLFQP